MSKRKKTGCLIASIFLLILIAVFWRLTSYYHEVSYCWQCGAKKIVTSFGETIEKTPVTLRAEKILGHECEHKNWRLDYFYIGLTHGDGFHDMFVPLLFYQMFPGQLLDYIELLPRNDWQKKALCAVGDPENLLKWLDVSILEILARELSYDYVDTRNIKKMTDKEWESWWSENGKYFEIMEDKQKAEELVKEFSDKIGNDSEKRENFESYYNYEIKRDIESDK